MLSGFDVETTIIERGHVHHPGNFLVSYSCATAAGSSFHFYTDPDFLQFLRQHIHECTELVGFNIKFDVQWLMRNGIEIPETCKIYDCSLAEFILTGQQAIMVSLNEVCEGYGIPGKIDLVASYWEQGISTENIPIDILEEYNNDDAEKSLLVRSMQLKLLTESQLRLLYQQGQDLLVLARAELDGVKFNREQANKDYIRYRENLDDIEANLEKYLPDFDHGIRFNWDSGDQLSALLYGGQITYDYCTSEDAVYKSGERKGEAYVRNHWHQYTVEFPRRFDPIPKSEVKKTRENPPDGIHYYSVDDPTLRQLKSRSLSNRRLLDLLARKAKLSKIVETFASWFNTIDRYGWNGGCIHGQFNQNVVRTGRLSSSKPNMQNTDEALDVCLISRYE